MAWIELAALKKPRCWYAELQADHGSARGGTVPGIDQRAGVEGPPFGGEGVKCSKLVRVACKMASGSSRRKAASGTTRRAAGLGSFAWNTAAQRKCQPVLVRAFSRPRSSSSREEENRGSIYRIPCGSKRQKSRTTSNSSCPICGCFEDRHSVGDCLYQAKRGMAEHVALLRQRGWPVPDANRIPQGHLPECPRSDRGLTWAVSQGNSSWRTTTSRGCRGSVPPKPGVARTVAPVRWP